MRGGERRDRRPGDRLEPHDAGERRQHDRQRDERRRTQDESTPFVRRRTPNDSIGDVGGGRCGGLWGGVGSKKDGLAGHGVLRSRIRLDEHSERSSAHPGSALSDFSENFHEPFVSRVQAGSCSRFGRRAGWVCEPMLWRVVVARSWCRVRSVPCRCRLRRFCGTDVCQFGVGRMEARPGTVFRSMGLSQGVRWPNLGTGSVVADLSRTTVVCDVSAGQIAVRLASAVRNCGSAAGGGEVDASDGARAADLGQFDQLFVDRRVTAAGSMSDRSASPNSASTPASAMSRRAWASLNGDTNDTTVPTAPARPVRPARCT